MSSSLDSLSNHQSRVTHQPAIQGDPRGKPSYERQKEGENLTLLGCILFSGISSSHPKFLYKMPRAQNLDLVLVEIQNRWGIIKVLLFPQSVEEPGEFAPWIKRVIPNKGSSHKSRTLLSRSPKQIMDNKEQVLLFAQFIQKHHDFSPGNKLVEWEKNRGDKSFRAKATYQ